MGVIQHSSGSLPDGQCVRLRHSACAAAQYTAFKEGYSFNTLLKGADLRDSLHVKRSGNLIKIAGGKTTATVGTNGAKVCMVTPPPAREHLLPPASASP